MMIRLSTQVTEPRAQGMVPLVPRICHLSLQYTKCIIPGIALVIENMTIKNSASAFVGEAAR